MFVKSQNFVQLFLTFTKLCHLKRDRLANFYISLEKRIIVYNSSSDLHRIWHDDAEHDCKVQGC